MESLTYGLTHVALAVRDLAKTLKFYQKVFNVEVMFEQAGFVQVKTPGCNDIIVFEERKDAPFGITGGILHFGFRLRNPETINMIIEKIHEAGGFIKDTGEFIPGEPYVFFLDPDGYEIEVWYESERETLT